MLCGQEDVLELRRESVPLAVDFAALWGTHDQSSAQALMTGPIFLFFTCAHLLHHEEQFILDSKFITAACAGFLRPLL